MNIKPVFIVPGIILLALFTFFFTKNTYTGQTQKKDVIAFLENFNSSLKDGSADTLVNYIEGDKGNTRLKQLLDILSNHAGSKTQNTLPFKTILLVKRSEVNIVNSESVEVTVPVVFIEQRRLLMSMLILQIRKDRAGQLKIVRIDAKRFFNNYRQLKPTITT